MNIAFPIVIGLSWLSLILFGILLYINHQTEFLSKYFDDDPSDLYEKEDFDSKFPEKK